jgi:hypothetical protein
LWWQKMGIKVLERLCGGSVILVNVSESPGFGATAAPAPEAETS